MSFVLDSSVALTWCFEDERTAATAALLDRVTDAGAVAPSLWPLEVLNGLAMAERRGRLDPQRRHRMTGLLQAPARRHRFRDGPECVAAHGPPRRAFSSDDLRCGVFGARPANDSLLGHARPRAPHRKRFPWSSPPRPVNSIRFNEKRSRGQPDLGSRHGLPSGCVDRQGRARCESKGTKSGGTNR
jgi:hypothetical protein